MTLSGYSPGVTAVGGELRFDVEEIMRAKGIPITPEGVEITARLLAKAAGELGLEAEIR